MAAARILLAGGGIRTETALRKAFVDNGGDVEVVHALDHDEALHALVSERFLLCVVRTRCDDPQEALSICADASEAGLRMPIIVLIDEATPKIEGEFLKAGAMSAMSWDGSQGVILRNFANLTLWLRKAEDNLRNSNDQLVMEMRTLQDERERAEASNAQFVKLAEDYALAKQELEVLNQQKNKFFSIIAHDLRSPFTSLLGFSALLVDRVDKLSTDKVREFATHIHESGNRVFRLLENLLEWSRLQMDRIEVAPSVFSVNEVAAKTIDVLAPVAAEKDISLLDEGQRLNAYADPYMIDAVIRNMVNNAIKFTPHGGTITLSYRQDKDMNRAYIDIQDTGVGMNADTITKLFKMSENVSTQGTDGENGTGLGLLLCYELMERNGGRITVESEIGAGSTFTCALPLTAP